MPARNSSVSGIVAPIASTSALFDLSCALVVSVGFLAPGVILPPARLSMMVELGHSIVTQE